MKDKITKWDESKSNPIEDIIEFREYLKKYVNGYNINTTPGISISDKIKEMYGVDLDSL